MLNLITFKEKITRWNIIQENDQILIAVSGGADSITLLHLLYALKKEKNFEIFCATLNHGIRDDAEKDVEFVKKFCKELNVQCFEGKIDTINYAKSNKLSLEEAGRILRYDFLIKLSQRLKCNKIAIAHNLNDLVENVIFRISRGTGTFGIPGMKPVNLPYIRPLIFFSRSEILDYIYKNNLKYVEDYTNKDIKYTRNFIRHRIVPLLKNINPNLEKAILHLSENVWELDEYIDKKTNIKAERLRGRLYFDLPEEKTIIIETIRRLCIKYFKKVPDKEKLDRLKANLGKTTFKISFWGNFGVEISYGKVLLGEFVERKEYEYKINTNLMNQKYYIDPYLVEIGKGGIIFNKEKINGDLILRNWRDGDKTKSGKKLKKIFVAKKIPSFIRRIIPVLTDNDGIIYVPKVYIWKDGLTKDSRKGISVRVVLKGGLLF
ncbi:tRNA lysidine(34) synthetase TilS [Thermosipho ferrireducens]|uniref:tRNA(Ile)-lysidine synthase n=1 Tax=Thermosipho ferrireducens TaxID=2571116 RepID=A0ABX7S993_9BACT|nr:tRNA lysidine(34) synthetase TilS [Thermosipho ferrireducens]QTA38834.1 tRNA lysidine(34) synthetase TilS [Thermosipho ferrireducens]